MADGAMRLDPRQEQAVRVRENVVVSAGAGSGKTRVLTERYVELVTSGVDVSQILTLTFTRKAAAEMFQRIYGRLRDEGEHSAEVATQLDRFDDAQISTLDSFCAAVLRDGAARFGLPPTVQTDEVALARDGQRIALGLLRTYGDHPVLGAYVRQYGLGGTLSNLLLPLAQSVLRISSPIDFGNLADRQERWLRRRRDDLERRIDRAAAAIAADETDGAGAKRVRDAVGAHIGRYDELYEVLSELPRRFGNGAAAFKAALNQLLEKAGSRRRGLLADWVAVTETQERSGEIRSLYEVLAPFQEEVIASRRARGVVSHQEVMELAVAALCDDLELRSLYKERFRYIMIDEFQDNNATQRDLLFLLAEEPSRCRAGVPASEALQRDKLFFVGDQKQSIYRFRGADVAVFRSLAHEVAHSLDGGEGGLLSLDTNYRSEPALILFFNALFPLVFGEAVAEYDAQFEPLNHRAARPAVRTDIVLAWVPPVDDREARTADGRDPDREALAEGVFAEAAWSAGEIRRLVEIERTHRYDQIAILFRTGSDQQKLERMLRRDRIPYRSQAVRSLFTESPASDLYALLQLVFYPDDREALVAYLRSPFVMLSDNALVLVLVRGGGSLSEVPDGLDAADRRKLARAAQLYGEVCRRIDRDALYEVIRYVWEEAGYRYALLHRSGDHAYLEHYEYLFALALRYRDRPATEFVDFLRSQIGLTEKVDELELPPEDGAVQLMTIHKSKGLEFPVVFVTGMDSGTRPRADLIWLDEQLGLTVRLPDPAPGERLSNVFEDHAAEEETRRDLAELRRLLYVAATRSEERLYFTAAVRAAHRGTSLFDLLREATGFDPEAGTIDASFAEMVRLEAIAPVTEREIREHRLPRTARRDASEARSLLDTAREVSRDALEVEMTPTGINALLVASDAAPAGGELFDAADLRSSAGDDGPEAAALGRLTHLLLEHRVGGETLARESWLAGPAWAAQAYRPDGDPGEDGTRLFTESWDLAERFLSSDLYGRLSTGTVHTEYPFVLALGEPTVYVSGTMDLVVETSEVVWVVDYKTDRLLDAAHYAGQMSIYRRAAGELFGKPVELRIFGLREGTVCEVPDRLDDILTLLQLPQGRASSVGSS
ncbi:MAG: UvrD-helicase domain-containing protein [Spirochaetales bacterium]|nr:UvrD-helicase domain-containing protein [Spirochaetales bacterium]